VIPQPVVKAYEPFVEKGRPGVIPGPTVPATNKPGGIPPKAGIVGMEEDGKKCILLPRSVNFGVF